MTQSRINITSVCTIAIACALLAQLLSFAAIGYGNNYGHGWDGLSWIVFGALSATAASVVMVASTVIGRPWQGSTTDRVFFWIQMPTGIPVFVYALWFIVDRIIN